MNSKTIMTIIMGLSGLTCFILAAFLINHAGWGWFIAVGLFLFYGGMYLSVEK